MGICHCIYALQRTSLVLTSTRYIYKYASTFAAIVYICLPTERAVFGSGTHLRIIYRSIELKFYWKYIKIYNIIIYQNFIKDLVWNWIFRETNIFFIYHYKNLRPYALATIPVGVLTPHYQYTGSSYIVLSHRPNYDNTTLMLLRDNSEAPSFVMTTRV